MNDPILVATAGHVDHGKSSLVQALTGIDPDRWAEEKRRGVTIDLGYAHLSHDARVYSFIDVPGHERFIHNMLAGIGGIDAALLIVAADESIMPQTREHARALRFLGIDQVIVVLTKVDLVDDDLLELLHAEVDDWLTERGWPNAPKVAFSVKRPETKASVLAELAKLAKKAAEPDAAFRLSIDRVFTQPGAGAVVTGTVDRGAIAADQQAIILPEEITARVRQFQLHGQTVDRAGPHSRLAMNLSGVHYSQLRRGDLVFSERRPRNGTKILVRLTAFDPDWGPGPKHEFHLHHLAARRLARMLWRQDDFAAFELNAPYPFWALDRGLIRDGSPIAIRAGFEVIHPDLRRAKLRQVKPLLADPPQPQDLTDWQRWFLGSLAGLGSLADVAALCGEPMRQALRDKLVMLDDDAFVARGEWTARRDAFLNGLEACHRQTPIFDWIPLRQANSYFQDRRWPRALATRLQQRMAEEGLLRVEADRIQLAGWQAQWSPPRRKLLQALLAQLEGDLPIADMRELRNPKTKEDLAMIESLLVWEKRLVGITPDLFADSAFLNRVMTALHARFANAEFSVGDLKDLFGITRKTAIPMLEWLDKQGCTQRTADSRRWIAPEPPLIDCRWVPPA